MAQERERAQARVVEPILQRAPRRPLPWYLGLWGRLFREKPAGTLGLVLIAVLLAMAAIATFSPRVIPYGFNETNVANRLHGPSAAHWFGTDEFGRDVFSRVIYGARASVIIGFGATLLGVGGATAVGLISGYAGGWFDTVLQRLVDVVMSIPGLLLLLVLITYTRPSLTSITVILGISIGFRGSRTIRSAVLSLKEFAYIEAARAVGARAPRIMAAHLLPNIIPLVIVMLTTEIGAAILAEASLSFLGLGVPPPTPTWGAMLSLKGRQFMFQAPWMALAPGLALAMTVYAWNMFGDAMRDILDPGLRGAGRSAHL